MSIWTTVSGFFGGGTTPGINPGAGQPPAVGMPIPGQVPPQPQLEPIVPVARGVGEAKGILEPQLKTEEQIQEEAAEAVVAAAEKKAKTEQAVKDPWSFSVDALSKLNVGRPRPQYAPAGRAQAGVGDTSLLNYYNAAGPAPGLSSSMGLLNMPRSRFY